MSPSRTRGSTTARDFEASQLRWSPRARAPRSKRSTAKTTSATSTSRPTTPVARSCQLSRPVTTARTVWSTRPQQQEAEQRMAWTNSKAFSATITDIMNRVTNGPKINTDTMEVALFDNTIAPSQTVASASTAYAAGVWASGGVSDAT